MQPRFHLMIPMAAFARILQKLQKLTGISTFMLQSLTGKTY
jgi:hypothetical protein